MALLSYKETENEDQSENNGQDKIAKTSNHQRCTELIK